MAQPRQRNLVNRLADAGEDAIQRFGSAPGADRLLGAVNGLRDRVDEMQKRLRGLDALEQQIATLERRLDKLEGKGSSSSSRSRSSASSSGTKKSSGSS
jgi:uncharacterized protein involved in exopolysaccharide biosynthesis